MFPKISLEENLTSSFTCFNEISWFPFGFLPPKPMGFTGTGIFMGSFMSPKLSNQQRQSTDWSPSTKSNRDLPLCWLSITSLTCCTSTTTGYINPQWSLYFNYYAHRLVKLLWYCHKKNESKVTVLAIMILSWLPVIPPASKSSFADRSVSVDDGADCTARVIKNSLYWSCSEPWSSQLVSCFKNTTWQTCSILAHKTPQRELLRLLSLHRMVCWLCFNELSTQTGYMFSMTGIWQRMDRKVWITTVRLDVRQRLIARTAQNEPQLRGVLEL